MPGSTTVHGIPYPTPGDTLSNFPTTAAANANSVDAKLPLAINAVVTTVGGVATIAHSLGRVPTVGLADTLTTAFRAVVTAKSGSNVTINVVSSAGVAYSGSISVQLLVL